MVIVCIEKGYSTVFGKFIRELMITISHHLYCIQKGSVFFKKSHFDAPVNITTASLIHRGLA